MGNLTNIDEILEYLATIGISHKYRDNQIHLKSDYYYDENYEIDTVIKNYKLIYKIYEYLKLLDNLLVNCTIYDKYTEKDIYIDIWFDHRIMFGLVDKQISHFTDINDLIKYMYENHPEHIRPVDIKIALK